MLEILIVLAAACSVFVLFLLVFFLKDRRERATGRRSGCQAHAQHGGGCRCKGHGPTDRNPEPLILERK